MPSPAALVSSAPAVQAHAQTTPEGGTASHTQNGDIGEGAGRRSEALSSNGDHGVSPLEGKDAIREGKEKVKAVMAASGVTLELSAEQTLSSSRGKIPATSTEHRDGATPSRKRSRSGSPVPSHPAPTEKQKEMPPEMRERLLQQYIERDLIHAAAMNDQAQSFRNIFKEKLAEISYYKELRQVRLTDPGAVFGYGYAGYGNGYTNEKTRLAYPAQRKRVGNRRARELHISRKDIAMQAEQLEDLVPVRLDIEFDKLKLRDTFTWNLQDRVVPTEVFAETLVEDFKLPPEMSAQVTQQVNREIQEQLQDYYPHVFDEEKPLDDRPYYAWKNDDMRVLIKLNITIGPHTLVDQFEWDINNPLNNPEEFARQMARDLSLSGEFTTAIAHDIREQTQMFTRSLYITGHPFDGRPIEDADVRDNFLATPLPTVFRPAQSAKDFAPYLYELSEADLQREELSILREQRRQKRSVNRRGGPALPDLKDRQRTVRTLVLSSVVPGAAESIESSRLFKLSRAASGRGRRAAGRADGGDDSDESESEESGIDSPAPSTHPATGTARTRNMRGAATAAQAAMRANYGRSATPELASLHHHETRTSARRFGGYDGREESVLEPTSLLVKLKIPREKYRQWMRNRRNIRSGEYQQGYLSTPLMASQDNTPQRSNPGASSMPPPPSPAMHQWGTPAVGHGGSGQSASQSQPSSGGTSGARQQQWQYYPDGRADAAYPPNPNHPPAPPPPWLSSALAALHEKYPNDSFEATMRHSAVDRETGAPYRVEQGAPPPPPSKVKYQWLPRIRCNDCPGKLYTAGPELTVNNFEIHLKNRAHKERVEQRRRGGG